MKRTDLCDRDCREANGCHGPRPCARCGVETCALDLSDGTDEAVCEDCREEAEREAAEDEAAYDPPEGGEAGADAHVEVIGDREAAEMFGLSRVALRQHCMASYVCPKGKVDVRKANPVVVGRSRRWRRSAIIELLSTRPE